MSPGTEFARDFCAGIGPLQLGVVLVFVLFDQGILALHDTLVRCMHFTTLYVKRR